MTIDVRRATADDAPVLAGMLARAFSADPCMNWVFRDDEARPGHLETLFSFALAQFLPHDHTFTTTDHGGASIWVPPGGFDGDLDDDTTALMSEVFGEHGTRLAAFLSMMAGKHPHDEHYYLAILGTDTGRQGQGIGSANMAPVLALCDRDGVPAYLESSNEKNVPLYERNGFAVTEVVHLPDGPPLWLMWRAPRPA